nr:YciI family protein [Methylobacterium sp. OTU13CASTA1]
MIVVSLTYVKSTEEADRHMADHLAWVKRGYAEHGFLASGRKVPRTGGVILARGPRAEIEAFIETDPFRQHGIADFEITEIDVTTAIEGLDALKG